MSSAGESGISIPRRLSPWAAFVLGVTDALGNLPIAPELLYALAAMFASYGIFELWNSWRLDAFLNADLGVYALMASVNCWVMAHHAKRPDRGAPA